MNIEDIKRILNKIYKKKMLKQFKIKKQKIKMILFEI